MLRRCAATRGNWKKNFFVSGFCTKTGVPDFKKPFIIASYLLANSCWKLGAQINAWATGKTKRRFFLLNFPFKNGFFCFEPISMAWESYVAPCRLCGPKDTFLFQGATVKLYWNLSDHLGREKRVIEIDVRQDNQDLPCRSSGLRNRWVPSSFWKSVPIREDSDPSKEKKSNSYA